MLDKYRNMHLCRELAQTPLFQLRSQGLPLEDRVRLSYERAKAIGLTYGSLIVHHLLICLSHFVLSGLSADDLLNLSPKFWELHTDPIGMPMDGAASVLLALQYNLCAGTLAMFAVKQPELNKLLQQVLKFEVSCVSSLYLDLAFSNAVLQWPISPY